MTTSDIPKQYEPKAAQDRWFKFWEDNKYFDAHPKSDRQQHTIMIPLPNVTGALHMGHALNGTLQDLITRWRRMQGYEALWMPGTDHAGIATQAVVERRMFEEEGLTRHDIGREALVKRIWEWKDTYEKRILDQLKQLGASCDWRRVRFTLDEVCSKAVRRTFFKFFKEGLVYRGKRLVNWDTHLQTAVADDEVFHEETDGHFWTFSYPLSDGSGKIVFSTTRPETMLGDTAVCVHPTDERYTDLIGKTVRIPLNDREVPIIADALLAKKELGTGAVKVTPAHDPNDYACALRNDLPMINILNADGTINENGGKYEGLSTADTRKQVIEAMESAGHYLEVEERKIPLAHSDRSKTPIEPYLSDQWFVKMDDLAQAAIDAVDDKRVRFFPSRYSKTYLDWLGEKRDWCISRQLWWGHRIPVWTGILTMDGPASGESLEAYKARCKRVREDAPQELSTYLLSAGIADDEFTVKVDSSSIQVCPATERAEQAIKALTTFLDSFVPQVVKPGKPYKKVLDKVPGFQEATDAALRIQDFHDLRQDDDVLDTWFSSALWPHATLGWPDVDHNPPLANEQSSDNGESKNEVLDFFYPGSVLITSRDIITLWVARMVLTGLYNMGDIPFAHVHVHPKILDGFGQTMSKSKGNGVNPLDLIEKYGTDAIRFTIASFAGETQDVRLPIGYECPHCEANIPQTLDHQNAKPTEGNKPTVKCPKCKKESQFTSPNFDADEGVPVARMISERFEYGRNFCNKLWNASRFALMNLEGYEAGEVSEDDLKLEDRWILSRLSNVGNEMTTLLGRYQFDAATRAIREFTWNEFCDWYLEMIKPRLRDDALRPAAQRVLVGVLDNLLRLLAPFIPFITEELWQRLNEIAPQRGLFSPTDCAQSCMIAPWPELQTSWQDESLENRFERLQETIVAVRNVRAVYGIAPSTPLKLHIRCSNDDAGGYQDVASQFENLSKTMLEAAGAEIERPRGSASFSLEDADGFIPLEGIVDREAELERLSKEREKILGHITGHEKKLANSNFVDKAPADVVNNVRETLAGMQKQLENIEEIIRQLSDDS